MRVLNVPSHIASVAFGVQDPPPAVDFDATRQLTEIAQPHLILLSSGCVQSCSNRTPWLYTHDRPSVFGGTTLRLYPVGAGISRRAVSLGSWFKSACVRGKGSCFHVDMKTCGTNH